MNCAAVLKEALEKLAAGRSDQAWKVADAFVPAVGTDREAALAFAELLAQDPNYSDALPVSERIVSAFGNDAELVIRLSAALVRVAEQRPGDEPPFVQGPAHLAAGACQRAFEGLSSAQRTDPRLGGYLQLNMADGLRMMGPEYDEDALKAYKLALTIDDKNGHWWFHLGLFHKWRGRFREGLDANQKAYARLGAHKPVVWNLAICATALGEGRLALEAWDKLGIKGELSSSGMPSVPGVPPMQVRVATLGEDVGRNDPLPPHVVTFEVLWVEPLSPCHGVVHTPTVRKANVDWGDVVLWDGAPVRVNTVEGRPVPVFPLLSILRPGDERRLRFVGMQKQRGMVQALAADLGSDVHAVVFDERSSSDGSSNLFYGKLIVPAATDLRQVRERLEQGLRTRAGLTLAMPKLYELLGDTPAAGKAHQAWGGIERVALKQGLLPSGTPSP
ncbi:MAG: tetratricopeptide repeat protein [Myxococcales bacterium]